MKAFLSATFVALTIIAAPAAQADDNIVATVGGQDVTMEELEIELKPQLEELEAQRFELLENGLGGLIAARLIEMEAKAKGVSQEELEQTEIRDKVPAPTDEAVAQVFEENKGQLGPDAKLEDLKPRIVEFLQSQGVGERAQEYLGELRAKYPVMVHLEAPRVDVAWGSHPPRGGDENAPIKIVGFSDYECPFCKRGEDTLAKVLEAYGDKVRYYHRDFPLDFHANAHPAAQAAHCANDQEKYWEFHDALFASEALSSERFQAIADELSLDRDAFDACMSEGKYKAAVDLDTAEGATAGVTGTPAFFINGRVLSGAQPFSRFQEVIDAELAKLAATKAAEAEEEAAPAADGEEG